MFKVAASGITQLVALIEYKKPRKLSLPTVSMYKAVRYPEVTLPRESGRTIILSVSASRMARLEGVSFGCCRNGVSISSDVFEFQQQLSSG